MKQLITILLLINSFKAFSTEFPDASNLWLREAPPNARMMAAYVTVENNTTSDLTLVGAYAPDFGMAEIHKTIEVDGLLKMREQKEMPLPKQSSIIMKPKGIHIMLMMPKRRFAEGEEARICLIYQTDTGEELIQHLDFPVKKQ